MRMDFGWHDDSHIGARKPEQGEEAGIAIVLLAVALAVVTATVFLVGELPAAAGCRVGCLYYAICR